MRPRDAHIPLLLWVCSALVIHLCVTGGAEEVKEVEEKLSGERAEIREAVKDVRTRVAKPTEMEVEIAEPPDNPPPPAIADGATPTDKSSDDDTADKEKPKEAEPVPPKPEIAEQKPEQPKPPEAEPPKPEEQKPKPEEEKPKEVAKEKPLEVVPPPADKRLAIKQAESNKIANNDAQRIAKEANKVDEEQMAKNRSLDQDSAHPSEAANVNGPEHEVGHSQNDKSGQSEEHEGDTKRAPGEGAKVSTDSSHEAPKPPEVATNDRATGHTGQGAAQPLAPQEASKGSVAGSGNPSPDSVNGPNGNWSLDPANPGGDGRAASSGMASKRRDFVPNVRNPGLPIPGALPGPLAAVGGFTGFEKAIGPEQLQKEREALGAKVRAEHRGRMDTNKFERWKPAIENYDPSVKLGDETALNAAANPFAEYLHDIHNRLHPIFGDEFLGSGLASKEGLDDMSLVTHVELVLSKDEGKILRMGVTKRSGSTIFDAVALEALDRASPFGKAPDIIASPDGNVYLHWEFHRDPFDACSTRNAHPIMLKHPPKLKPNLPPPASKWKPRGEGGVPGSGNDDPGPLLPFRKK